MWRRSFFVLLEMQGKAPRADTESAPTASEAAGTRSLSKKSIVGRALLARRSVAAAGALPGCRGHPALRCFYFFSGLYRSTFSEKCFVKNCTNGPNPKAQIRVPSPISPPNRKASTAHSASVNTRQPK